MNEKLVVVKNTISSEDLAAQMKKMRCAGNGGRAKEFDLEEKLAKAGVPEVVVKVMASEGFDECRIPLAVKNWVEGYSGKGTSSSWLSGGSGAGKSTAAAWAVKGIVEASGEPESLADGCKFVAVSDLVHGTWMGSGLYGEGNKWRLIEPLTTCPLLVLDDLGSCVRQGREECSVVREVVDKRWGHMLPTGVGGGIIIDGKIVGGDHGCGGEIGHIPVMAPSERVCGCGNVNCLECYASAAGIIKNANELAEKAGEERRFTKGEEIFEEVKQGGATATAARDMTVDYLARALAGIMATVDPSEVIVGGGLSGAGDLLMVPLAERLDRYVFPPMRGCYTLRRATLGNEASILGAVYQALQLV